MRKFVAGFCVIVVALQVLIGVPLVVCLVFYALTQSGGPVAFEMHSGPQPTISPPPYSNPEPMVNPRYSNPQSDRFESNPQSDRFERGEMPSGLVPAVMGGPPPLIDAQPTPAERVAIEEEIERRGSIVQGAVFERSGAQFVQAKPDLDDSQPRLSEPAAGESKSASTAVPAPPLLDSLQAAAVRLYEHAARLEEESEFDRADQVRTLARGLRREIITIRPEVIPPQLSSPNSPGETESVPPTASYRGSAFSPCRELTLAAKLSK